MKNVEKHPDCKSALEAFGNFKKHFGKWLYSDMKSFGVKGF